MTEPRDKIVLVVDDEADARTFLSTVLEDEGFRVMTAADGDEALARMREQVPDFVSLDLVMPRKSGIRFLREVRRNKQWSRVPVMIVTGHARDDLGRGDLKEAMAGRSLAGRGCYLEKPVTAESFAKAVKRELGIVESSPDQKEVKTATLKKELSELVEHADDETLEEMRRILRERGR